MKEYRLSDNEEEKTVCKTIFMNRLYIEKKHINLYIIVYSLRKSA